MIDSAGKSFLRKTIFAAIVAASLLGASVTGFFFGWKQVKLPLIVAVTFHGVTEKPMHPWEIKPEALFDFINQFKRHDYKALDPASLSTMLDNGFSGRHFLVTFDDGLISSVETIKTLYREHAIKSVFFIITSLVGTPGYVDKLTLLDLQNNFGCHIALHGRRHYEVSKILNEGGNLTEEIETARTDLSAMMHNIVDWYAYAYGDYNASATACIASTGIKLAFTIDGENIRQNDKRMMLPRVMYLKGAKEAGEADPSDWLPPANASTGSLTITLSLLVGFLGLSWAIKFLTFFSAWKSARNKAQPPAVG
ncbi:MAG: polysaccharide deacetylase family protein [Candidatus Riflebacteria bacterium]|jgi:peptidoglycan/xylan/chitin deacetylase (PgdA/CDA1 family)|nr:polysaccharide deacetylase family protein [Candidatus Riflebacteria bacterium]